MRIDPVTIMQTSIVIRTGTEPGKPLVEANASKITDVQAPLITEDYFRFGV